MTMMKLGLHAALLVRNLQQQKKSVLRRAVGPGGPSALFVCVVRCSSRYSSSEAAQGPTASPDPGPGFYLQHDSHMIQNT